MLGSLAVVLASASILGCHPDPLDTRGGYHPRTSTDPVSEPTTPPTPPTPPEPTVTPPAPTPAPTGATGDTAGEPVPPRLFLYVGADDARIHVFSVDPASGALTDAGAFDAGVNPSFLAFSPDQRFVYAVNESTAELAAFTVDAYTGALALLNRVPSNGSGPAHVAVDATGAYALAANYGGGTVTSVAVLADGSLGNAVSTLATGANAHQIVVAPDNRFAFVPNLGANTVSQLVFDPASGALSPNAVPSVSVAAGAGPRHLVFHPSAPYAYLVNETDDTVIAMAYDPALGRLTPFQTLGTLPVGANAAGNYCAEIALGAGARFLYVSNRGDDSLAQFAVDPVTGALALVGHTPTDGDWPRHFSLSPAGDLLFVGNQNSDEVVAFAVDPATGALTELATTVVSGPAYVGVVDLAHPR